MAGSLACPDGHWHWEQRGRFHAQATADQLTEWGHKVNVTGDWSNGSAPVVIQVSNGVLHGGADPRRGRFIFGR